MSFILHSISVSSVQTRYYQGKLGQCPVSVFLPISLLQSVQLVFICDDDRSFIYPLRIKNGKNTPTEIVLMAFVFCLVNGYIQAVYLINPCTYRTVSWLYDARFLMGACLFILGMAINWNSDSILRNLRSDGSSGYKIPHGGLFEYISGANYFGECLEWIGYAILCWNLAGVAFAIFTIANIGPRAWQHHCWYKETFGDEYPANRKAIIPFLI